MVLKERKYRWVPLKLEFFGSMRICLANQYSGLSVPIYIKLYKEKDFGKNLG